eukprot:154990-Prorocentrum_minimum.AAC.1
MLLFRALFGAPSVVSFLDYVDTNCNNIVECGNHAILDVLPTSSNVFRDIEKRKPSTVGHEFGTAVYLGAGDMALCDPLWHYGPLWHIATLELAAARSHGRESGVSAAASRYDNTKDNHLIPQVVQVPMAQRFP